jgi:predicted TIM-barrel fold metal-dependent hydrolase
VIIDIHAHQTRYDDKLEKQPYPPAQWIDVILAEAAHAGIDKLCLLGDFTFYAPPDEVVKFNDCTMAMVERHPGRVFGLCFLNARHDRAFCENEIDRCVRNGPLCGVKLELEVNARNKRLDPIMEQAAALDVFVLHHSWYKTVDKYDDESDPSDIAHLAARHPNTRIVMAHLTAGGMRGVLDIARYENVIVDTSGSQPFAGMVEYAVNKLGAHRVAYGSDIMGRDFSAQLGRVLGAKLTDEQREMVLWRNAARLLKIEQEVAA